MNGMGYTLIQSNRDEKGNPTTLLFCRSDEPIEIFPLKN
jgi:hypothetical protein